MKCNLKILKACVTITATIGISLSTTGFVNAKHRSKEEMIKILNDNDNFKTWFNEDNDSGNPNFLSDFEQDLIEYGALIPDIYDLKNNIPGAREKILKSLSDSIVLSNVSSDQNSNKSAIMLQLMLATKIMRPHTIMLISTKIIVSLN